MRKVNSYESTTTYVRVFLVIGAICCYLSLLIVEFNPSAYYKAMRKSAAFHEDANEVRSFEPFQYFAMCLITKNDYLDIVEWIEYHKRMGCSKFYLFDHNSTVPMLDIIRNYVSDGVVEYFFSDFDTVPRPQLYVYEKCIKDFGNRHKFMAFLDSDEFIVVANKSASIPSILKNYEQYGGLTLNWKVFGSSGHVKRPTGGILSNYNKCYNTFQLKTIGNTAYAIQPGGNPHSFLYKPNYYAVDTSYNRINGPWNINRTAPVPLHVYDIMYINHYNLKSVEDYKHKVAKGKADNSPPSNDQLFNVLDSLAIHDCGYLQMPVNYD